MDEPIRSNYRGRTWQDYLGIVIRRRWAVIAAFTSVVAIVALQNLTATPLYKASTQILIERHAPRLLEQPGATPLFDFSSQEFYQTQYKLLESPALAKKVMEKLQLKNHPFYSSRFKDLPPDDETRKQKAEDDLVAEIAQAVQVNPIRESSLVNVSFSHSNPKFAALVVNTLAQAYIEQSLDLRFYAAQETAGWLQQKLTEAAKKLEESENRLNKYKREQNIVTMEDKESITNQKLEALNKELVSAQTRRMEAETRFKEVSQGKPIPQVINNPLILTLKGQEAKLVAEQSELGRKFGPEHPRMIQLNNELASTRRQVAEETIHVVQSVKNEYSMAKAQEENLKAAMEAQKVDSQDLSERAIQYRVLLRDVETNRALYDNMLRTLKTTTATENIPATNIRVVYAATVPDIPFSPHTTRNLILSAIFGIILAVSLAMTLEGLDTTLKTPQEIETLFEAPNLAVIPHLVFSAAESDNGTPELIVHHGTKRPAAESYRALRTSIMYSSPGKAPQVLLVTSSLPSEGKTLTSANLASVMAMAEGRVLLVDSDLRRPSLHQVFQLDKEPGLSNFLVGEIEELPVRETLVPNLYLTTAGTIPPNPSELLGSARMEEFLTLARKQFERIILDSPPLMSVTDAAILSVLSDGVIMVVKGETVPRKAAIEAREELQEVQARLLGTILNDVHLKRDGYYYNYYYYRYYHSYYTNSDGIRSRRRNSHSGYVHPGVISWVKNRLNNFKSRPHG